MMYHAEGQKLNKNNIIFTKRLFFSFFLLFTCNLTTPLDKIHIENHTIENCGSASDAFRIWKRR